LKEKSAGHIATIMGRYWAMDRDKRWERVQRAYDAIVFANGHRGFATHAHALADAYEKNQTDEFVEPRIVADYTGAKEGDAALFFNFRPDRAREITTALTQEDFADLDRRVSPWRKPFDPYVCMTEYDAKLKLPVAFTKTHYTGMFPEVIAGAHLKQLRCAETEKYAHVTYFFNGGVETPFAGEERVLIPSPKDVPTYDKKPQMSEAGVRDAVVRALRESDFDFVLVNFANPDMVGHTGVLSAAIAAVEAVDDGVGAIVDAALAKNGAVLITADHGNCEQMVDPLTGGPHTAHTTNRVPLLYVREGHEKAKLRDGGRIADVAPTMLKLLGLAQPREMTGRSLIDE
jgi:2,3-bisphosphoglycerate-independent phosphoglycerate mutase